MEYTIPLRDDRSEKVEYDSPDYPYSFCEAALSDFPNYSAPSHWHDDLELMLILDGEMDYNINGHILHLGPGQGVFVNGRQMHFGFSPTRQESHFICILFHPLLLCTVQGYERDFVLPVLRNGCAPFVFLDPAVAWQRSILQTIRDLHALQEGKAAPLWILAGFLKIWALLYENLPAKAQAQPQDQDLSAMRNMVGFIQKEYARRITLREIAAAGAVGQSKCCKLFSACFGRSPMAYLSQYRLNKSLELLEKTSLTVTEIALAVGFGGASYFTEVFHRDFGQTPSEFRRACRPPETNP